MVLFYIHIISSEEKKDLVLKWPQENNHFLKVRIKIEDEVLQIKA